MRQRLEARGRPAVGGEEKRKNGVSPEWHFHKTYVMLSRRALAMDRGSVR